MVDHNRPPRGGGRSSGFTLVELMVVVAVIAILAAIAIPAFSRYVKKSRTAEATGHLNRIWSGSLAYYEVDHADSTTAVVTKQFPGLGLAVSFEGDCCLEPGGKCPGSAATYADSIWVALKFNIPDPHLYRASYATAGNATLATFTAIAHGDLDCDGRLSTFARMGRVNAGTGDVEASSAAYIDQEIE